MFILVLSSQNAHCFNISAPQLLIKLLERRDFDSVACFHTQNQLPCISIRTKEKVCIRIELNSPRICQGHNHGRHFYV